MMNKMPGSLVNKASACRLEAIRNAALQLFVTVGYQAVSLRQLAHQAGLQVGSLYHYIESKQCLLFDFIEEHEYRLLQGVSKLPLDRFDPEPALEHYLGAYLRIALTRRQWHIVSRRESYCLESVQKTKIDALRGKQTQLLKDIIALGITQGRFRTDDLNVAVAAVGAMLDGTVLGSLSSEMRAEVLIKGLQRMVLRSLASVDTARDTQSARAS